MTIANVDQRLVSYRDRKIRLKLALAEKAEETRADLADIDAEMKAADGITKDDMRGVNLSVKQQLVELKRAKETPDKRSERITAEAVAESLGDYAQLPLGTAAVARVRADLNG